MLIIISILIVAAFGFGNTALGRDAEPSFCTQLKTKPKIINCNDKANKYKISLELGQSVERAEAGKVYRTGRVEMKLQGEGLPSEQTASYQGDNYGFYVPIQNPKQVGNIVGEIMILLTPTGDLRGGTFIKRGLFGREDFELNCLR